MDETLKAKVLASSKELIREQHAEMRSIRDSDLKIMPFFFTVAGFTLSADLITMLRANTSPVTNIAIAVLSGVFLIVLWWQIEDLIRLNNRKYKALGELVHQIWEVWEVEKYCMPGQKDGRYGQGDGWKRTIWVIRCCAIAVLAIIVACTVLTTLQAGLPQLLNSFS